MMISPAKISLYGLAHRAVKRLELYFQTIDSGGGITHFPSESYQQRGDPVDIIYSKQAMKALNGLDKPTRARIIAGIYKLPAGDIKKLKGYTAAFRLRVGDYRILFKMSPGEIRISEVLPHGSAYKK